MEDDDVALRNLTYRMFVELGRAPGVDEVAAASAKPVPEVRDGWRRLSDAHALVLNEGATELRMANPFAAAPTPYRVHAGGHTWFANCAWDAFGICAALHVDGRIETVCPECGEGIEVAVRDQHPDDETLLFHCLVPAGHWWDDIVFT
jgi:hypothetical protein